MKAHSKLPPSSAARRVACPGSRALEEQYPASESAASIEGGLAHQYAAWVLQNRLGNAPTPFPDSWLGQVSDDMKRGADIYVEKIKNDTVGFYGFANIHIEERLDISVIHSECWGTPDAWFYDSQNKTVYLYDYKYGHRPVDPVENWQLIEYAAGIAQLCGMKVFPDSSWDGDDEITFHLIVVQPRDYSSAPIKSWAAGIKTLRRYWERLRAAEALAFQDVIQCQTSDSCLHCSARHVCPALQKTTLNISEFVSLNTPQVANANHLGSELKLLQRAASLLTARITGLETEALARFQQGENVPYFKIDRGRGKEVWDQTCEYVVGVGQLLGLELQKPADLITPNQARKLGFPENVLQSLIKRIPGELKLMADDGSQARKIFNKGVKP